MVRAIRSVSLPKEMDDIVEKNILDFSSFVQSCIEEKFMDNSQINKKIKEHQIAIKELEKLKSRKKLIKDYSNEEKEFIDWASKNLEKNPGEVHENCRVYNQKFGKNLKLGEFEELIK